MYGLHHQETTKSGRHAPSKTYDYLRDLRCVGESMHSPCRGAGHQLSHKIALVTCSAGAAISASGTWGTALRLT
eukprot:5087067-Amphidinium_carterae.1